MSKYVTCKLPGERGERFVNEIGTDTVFIWSPTPFMANSAASLDKVAFYMLDLRCYTQAEIDAMIEGLAKRNNITVEYAKQIVTEDNGICILAEGCEVKLVDPDASPITADNLNMMHELHKLDGLL